MAPARGRCGGPLGLDSADGLAAWQALQGQPVRVLVVSRTPMAGAWIKHGATVRELNEHMRLLLSSPHATPVAEPALLLRHCRGEFGAGAVALEHAQLHVRVDPGNGCVQLPAGVALAEVIAALDRSGWHVVPDLAAAALPQRISFEALFFALPEHLRQALPAMEPSHALQLHQWPELTAGTSSPAQLLAIAHLPARPWRPQALADACKLPLQTVECLFAAALASGLAQTAEIPVPATQRRPDSGNTRFFFLGRTPFRPFPLLGAVMSLPANKLVFVGGMGAGKTTAVRSISDVESVSIEMPLSQDAYGDKAYTTVALDYSSSSWKTASCCMSTVYQARNTWISCGRWCATARWV